MRLCIFQAPLPALAAAVTAMVAAVLCPAAEAFALAPTTFVRPVGGRPTVAGAITSMLLFRDGNVYMLR